MATYADGTLDRISPTLLPGEKEHVLVYQDESIFHANEYHRQSWLMQDQQAIRKKGNGRVIHVSDFISETIGRIKLSDDQIAQQLTLPADLRLPAFEARKITYPGKNFNAWWDLSQLIEQLKVTIKAFEHTHPGCIVIFVFDRSSAHEGFGENALNVHNMNVNPGKKQRRLRDTVIPLSNPEPIPGKEDTRGQVQKMCFPDDHPNPELKGQPKGIKVVLQERKSVWDLYTRMCKEDHAKQVGKCRSCSKSQTLKDTERRVMFAEVAGQGDPAPIDDIAGADDEMTLAPENLWCCM